MELESVKEELDKYLREFYWTYIIDEGSSVRFNNVRVESLEERRFIRSLKQDGSEYVFKGRGDLDYRVAREDGKLWLSGFANDKMVGDRREIGEGEAVRVFRNRKEGGMLGGVVDMIEVIGGQSREIQKELAPNELRVRIDEIRDIGMKYDEEVEFLQINGERFTIELSRDGGCRIKFL